MRVVAFDPGEHCGWAVFIDSVINGLGVLDGRPALHQFLDCLEADVVICEDYKIRPKNAGGFEHDFQSVNPARVIGAIEYASFRVGAKFVLQQPSIKRPAAAMAGGVYSKTKSRHSVDAYLHGVYWLVKNGHLKRN